MGGIFPIKEPYRVCRVDITCCGWNLPNERTLSCLQGRHYLLWVESSQWKNLIVFAGRHYLLWVESPPMKEPYRVAIRLPCEHEAFTQCCFNVGPPSSTLAQHWNSIGWMSRVCWVVFIEILITWPPKHPAWFITIIIRCVKKRPHSKVVSSKHLGRWANINPTLVESHVVGE